MAEREEILKAYQDAMHSRWKKGYLNLDDVRALKIFCQVYQISREEHARVAEQVGLDARQLLDEENRSMDDWLVEQRKVLPAGEHGLAFAPPERRAWKRQLPQPPSQGQNLAAIAAGLLFIGAAAMLIVTFL